MRAPESLTIKEDANHNLGFCWTSPEYPAGTSIDFGIWWWYNSWGTIYEGYEFGARITELGNGVYQIGFEAAGDDRDYNELVIIVEKEEVIEPPVLSVYLDPEEITTGESSLLYIYITEDYWCSLPLETRVNFEIIKGFEYGNLFNYLTGEKSKIFTNLEYYSGQYLCIDYIADGISVDQSDSVVIRVSTTDPEIIPKEITLYIKPPPIYVYTVPEVLGADEEADVIIKKRNPDGTLEDFPSNQTFELAVLDGCVNGNFMVGGVIDVYFEAAQQPIKFVTADSIDPEYDKVLIRVGTDLGGYYRPIGNITAEEEQKPEEFESKQIGSRGKTQKERREKFDKLIAERKAEAKAEAKEGGNEPLAPVVPLCAPDDVQYGITYSYSNVLVQDECGSGALKCTTSVQIPEGFKADKIEATGEYNFNKPGYLPKILTTRGGRTFLFYDGEFILYEDQYPYKPTKLFDAFYSPYEIETCFNQNLNNGLGAFQYEVRSVDKSDNFLYKNFLIVVNPVLDIPIISENQLDEIPDEKICKVLTDFELQRYRQADGENNFWKINDVEYEIVDIAWENEKYHVRDATRYLNEQFDKADLKVPGVDGYFIIKSLKGHLQTTFGCSEYITNYDDAKNKGEKYIKNALYDFMIFHQDHWYPPTVDILFENVVRTYKIRELFAHWSDDVQKKITRYQNKLLSREGFDLIGCNYNKIKNWDPFAIYRNSL